jgi:hypothetical protein
VVDLDDLTWSRDLPDLGVRVTSESALAVERDDDHRELRFLRLGGEKRDPSTHAGFALGVLKVLPWIGSARLTLVDADLVHGDLAVVDVDASEVAASALTEVERGVGELRHVLDDPRARPGMECGWCTFVAGCEAHRG